MTTKAIALWYDTASDDANPVWVVSRDEIDDQGGAETSETIRTHEDYDGALYIAETHARLDGLPIYEDGEFRDVEPV